MGATKPRLPRGPFRYQTHAVDLYKSKRFATKPMKQVVMAPSMSLYSKTEKIGEYKYIMVPPVNLGYGLPEVA